jgi:hypothetical protein
LSRIKFKSTKWNTSKNTSLKADGGQSNSGTTLWKERKLRDYRKANDLCYFCGDRFEPGHLQKCPKKARPQVNALVVNDLNVELSEEVLNKLQVEDVLADEMGNLSLNALSGTDSGDSLKIRALVQNQVMLILVDSGSSHNFVSRAFAVRVGLVTIAVKPMHVKVANGHALISSYQVFGVQWLAQGHTFHTDMRVLDLGAYDAILGYDWLRTHSRMVCHWELKTMDSWLSCRAFSPVSWSYLLFSLSSS